MNDVVTVNNMARLNVTWNGQNGDLTDPIPYDVSDAEILRMATEAIATGGIPGIQADPLVNLRDFVVDRFAASEAVPFNRIMARPKTPFGG